MFNPLDLTGKTALVTGAGQGIGLAIAKTLAQAGADIIIAEFNAETGQIAVQSIESLGRKAVFIPTNVADPGSVDAMAASAATFAPVDILVNNAGVVKNIAAEAMSNEDWRWTIDINVNGVYWVSRAIGQQMLARGNGNIINIASMSGLIANKPQPQTAYNVSKAAVIMLTKSLAAEWAARGVRVNSVSPGYIGTEMTKLGMSNTEWSDYWLEMTPMGRIGDPLDVANAVLFLASEASKFATGSNIVIDGGYTAW
ncbi:MAG: SDR family NAD(P)-dependent oxidoreductase [Phototrophicaceae bacterium]|jgi:NAD(P)-dependent dehydrogenase (short-subunit alcohol dehydrogenase family)